MNSLNSQVLNLLKMAGLLSAAATVCLAQAAPPPDVLLLVDGEKLIGHFESADASNVIFKSDIAGEVKIPWDKIQDLQSSAKFAVAQKGQTFDRHADTAQVPQGTVSVADQKVTITPASGPPQVVPVANTQNVIPQDSFLGAFKRAGFQKDWHGAASAGFALVQSTQRSKTFTTALNLVRTVPSEAWISPRYRTTINFDSAYGTSTASGVTIKTNIIHADLEQDEYVSRRVFLFGDASFDHNYSQGLDLQYTLGGGLGFVAYKDARQELDLKGQIAYITQNFTGAKTTHLVGAILGETYNRSLLKGVTFHQELAVLPTFNDTSAWSANFLSNLAVPVTKTINFSIGLLDNYLNNPSPGFQRNSFQIITNLTFKIH